MTEELSARTDETPAPEISIVGVGNEIMGDDGVGPEVIERLENATAETGERVRLVDAGTTGFFALEAMSGAERAVVVDAIATGARPGTIHEYRCVDGTFETDVPDMTMHDVSFTEAMVVGRGVYDLPEEIRILGVEPDTVSVGTELSEAVDRAASELADMLAEDIIEAGVNGQPPDTNNSESDT